MLREAIDAKRRERGGHYSIRQMALDAECDHSYISLGRGWVARPPSCVRCWGMWLNTMCIRPTFRWMWNRCDRLLRGWRTLSFSKSSHGRAGVEPAGRPYRHPGCHDRRRTETAPIVDRRAARDSCA